MKQRLSSLFVAPLVIWVVAFGVAFSHGLTSGVRRQQSLHNAQLTSQEQQAQRLLKQKIEQRDEVLNGIDVGEPKVYDDSLLQQMLNAAEAKLASMQLLDQSGIAAKLGAVSGASQQISSFGLNLQGPSLPGTVTTAKSGTGGVKETSTSTLNVEGKTSTSNTIEATSGLPTRDVVTTVAAANPPAVVAPAPTTSLPSSFTVSASDILNEELQLTYEIANLRLLLEGSLSDRLLRSKTISMVKPRVTLGFPVTLSPDKRHKGSVAIVEVEVAKNDDLGDGEAPAITALLPREKTYNVASITESNTSVGGGVVTQIIGVSGSWLRGHKTYYLVQDQDTLALTFQPENEPKSKVRAGFLWQFRPVLGRSYVRGGLRQTFVQIAFPSNWSAETFGTVNVRTYWRKYDPKNAILKEVLPNSVRETVVQYTIPRYKLELPPRVFNATSLEDIGNGQMLVRVFGRFLTDTYIRIGPTAMRTGTPGFTFEHYGFRFIAPISELATKRVVLVARDGQEVPLEIQPAAAPEENGRALTVAPSIKELKVSAVDEVNSLVTLTPSDRAYLNQQPPLVFIIGGRVFGYSDSPMQKDANSLFVVVPTALLTAHPEVMVKPLFAPMAYNAKSNNIPAFDTLSQTERLVVLEQSKSWAKFLLYGNRLIDISILAPIGVKPQNIGRPEDANTLRLIELSADQIKSHKNLVLQRSGERPIVIPIPPVEFKDVKEPKPTERVTVNADQVVIEGEGLRELEDIEFNGTSIPFEISKDGKTVRLKSLRVHGVTTTATTQSLEFTFKKSKTKVKLEVVNSKTETVPK